MRILRFMLPRWLYGGTRTLRPHEVYCIDEWKNKLSPAAAKILDRQLQRFNLIQRSSGGTIITFYDLDDRNYSTWTDTDLFVNRSSELTAARIWFYSQPPTQPTRIKADIVLHNGRLSSIEFSKPPKSLTAVFTASKVQAFVDPMQPLPSPSKATHSTTIDRGITQTLLHLSATNLREPRGQVETNRLTQIIDARLPIEYLQLMSLTDGLTAANWRVFGLSEIRRIVQPTGNFYLLAEATDGRAVGVLQESEDEQLYLISPEKDEPEIIHLSVLDYIRMDSDERTGQKEGGLRSDDFQSS